MIEEWKEFGGGYFVSVFGAVKSSDSKYKRGQVLRPYLHNGYPRISVGGKYHYVHRLVASAFIPNPDSKPEVNHKNFDRADNRACNLEWVTRTENNNHALVGGRMAGRRHFFGESCPTAKLTAADVDEIRRTPKKRGSIKRFAEKFSVSRSAIERALRGATWTSVCALLCLVTACRTDKPPALSMICITDGFGGMDCSVSDGTHKYLPPSASGNMWCTTQVDMQNFSAWCYKAPVAAVEEEMQKIDAVARQ